MKTSTENKTIKLNIVKITDTKENSEFNNLYAVDITSEYYKSEAPEIILRPIFSQHKSLAFFSDEVTAEVVGYFNYEPIDTVKWDTLNAFQEYPHKRIAENNGKEIVIAGNVSKIASLRFIQLTEKYLMGYVTTVEDKYNKENSIVNKEFSNSELYYFFKIGEYDGISIFRYSSDMVIYNQQEEIHWIGSLGYDINGEFIDEHKVSEGHTVKLNRVKQKRN